MLPRVTHTIHNKSHERKKFPQFYKINENEYFTLSTTKIEVFGTYQWCGYDTNKTILYREITWIGITCPVKLVDTYK